MLLCTRRLFRQFSLGRKPSMHECHLTFLSQTGCLKLYQILKFSLGTLSIWFAPLEVAVSEWQWIYCKQQESTSKKWRCHWAAAHVFFLGMAAAPRCLQGIWNCSAKLGLTPTYLEMQKSRVKQIRLAKWGGKAGAWEGKRLPAVQNLFCIWAIKIIRKKENIN